jgi:parallel beta-helix repeat protein
MAALSAFAASSNARASNLNCGDTLASGSFLLETDLTCPSGSVGLYITGAANLDMGGHTITMAIAGTGRGLVVTGVGAKVQNGAVTGCDRGIDVSGGGSNRFSDLQVNGNNIGMVIQGSTQNRVLDSQFNDNAVVGIFVGSSDHNHFQSLEILRTSGIGPAAGIRLVSADQNSITRSTVSQSLCTNISMEDSSKNTVCFNTVQDSNSFFTNGPAVNVLLFGASSGNLICNNELSATSPSSDTEDGLNVGCKGNCVCGFQTPTTGASDNVIVGNTANGEHRYGFAQATGNPGNHYVNDNASGNGVADFAIDP